MERKHWLRWDMNMCPLYALHCGSTRVTFSAFRSRWALRFPAWPLQGLFNKYVCSHLCFNQHSQMFLLRQIFPVCCFLKCGKFWHVWFSYIDSVCVIVRKLLSRVQLFVNPWTVACQAPLSMESPRPERIPEWVAVPFPGIFLTQGWNPGLPHWRWIHLSHQGSP